MTKPREIKDAYDFLNEAKAVCGEIAQIKADREVIEARSEIAEERMLRLIPIARRIFERIGPRAVLDFSGTMVGWDPDLCEPAMINRVSCYEVNCMGLKLDEPGPEEDDTAAYTDADIERAAFIGSAQATMGLDLSGAPDAVLDNAMKTLGERIDDHNRTLGIPRAILNGSDDGEDTPKRPASPALHAANAELVGGAR